MPSFKLSIFQALVIGAVLTSASPVRRDEPSGEFSCSDVETDSAAWYHHHCDVAQGMNRRTFGSTCNGGCNDVNPAIAGISAALPAAAKTIDDTAHTSLDDTSNVANTNTIVPNMSGPGLTCNGGCHEANPTISGTSAALPATAGDTNHAAYVSEDDTGNLADDSHVLSATNVIGDTLDHHVLGSITNEAVGATGLAVDDANAILDPADCSYPSAVDAASDLDQGAVDTIGATSEGPMIQPFTTDSTNAPNVATTADHSDNPISLDTAKDTLVQHESTLNSSGSSSSLKKPTDDSTAATRRPVDVNESLTGDLMDENKIPASSYGNDSNHVSIEATEDATHNKDMATQAADKNELSTNHVVQALEVPVQGSQGAHSDSTGIHSDLPDSKNAHGDPGQTGLKASEKMVGSEDLEGRKGSQGMKAFESVEGSGSKQMGSGLDGHMRLVGGSSRIVGL